MTWIISVSVFIALSLAPAYAQPPLPPAPGPMPYYGTCASIGYSDKCCPQSSNSATACRASDGNCHCGHDCHLSHRNDCCMDVACPSNPTRCAHVGIYGCCNGTRAACEVRNSQSSCFCDTSCHTRGDCCPDACALTCGFHDKAIGCCQWSTNPPSSCYIGVGNCYCDSYCAVFGDCCSDVLPNCPNSGPNSQSWRSQQTRLQSVLEQELTVSQVQDYYSNRGRRVNTASDNVDRDYIHHRMALAARTQRVRGNAVRYNEFQRGRARMAARPPGLPPPYNYNY